MLAICCLFFKTVRLFVMLLTPLVVWSYVHGEMLWYCYAMVLLPVGLLALAVESLMPEDSALSIAESFLLLPCIWFGLSFVAALPFMQMGVMSAVDAWFVAVSGITTTGAELVVDLSTLPESLLYYRMWLQFLGGLGIIILAMAWTGWARGSVSPSMQVDLPGPIKVHSFAPNLSEATRSLWLIYAVLWLTTAMLCYQVGMTLYEAVFESMSMVSTGGFGLYSSNLAHYNSDALKAIVALVLLVSSSSFILHYRFFSSGVFSVYIEDKEWTLYLLLLLFVMLVLGSVDCFFGVGVASVDLLFTVVSMLSTAGHQSVVTTWPVSVAFLLMVMSLLGGCSGSTSGGIKVLRWRFLWRDFTNALRGQLHPQAVFADSLDNSQTSQTDFVLVRGFLVAYVMTFLLFWWLLLLAGVPLTKALAMVAACLSNTGTNLLLGADSYAVLSDVAKGLLTVLMLFGRMELMVVFALFSARL